MKFFELDFGDIRDARGFHRASVEAFGFAAGYAATIDGWIERVIDIHRGDVNRELEAEPIVIAAANVEVANRHSPELVRQFVEAVAIVNLRCTGDFGGPAVFVLFR